MIAFVTCRKHPAGTGDDRLVATTLDAAIESVCWDDPRVDWGRFTAVVIRSPWDYHLRIGEFLGWVDRLEASGTTLWNPASVIRWNADKRYLSELALANIAVVPTERLSAGTAPRLDQLLRRWRWPRAVIKPAISASAHGTWVTDARAAGEHQQRLAVQLATADVLIQPYLEEIEDGEWSLVFLAGHEGPAFSHAVIKRPAAGEFRVQSDYGGEVFPADPPRSLLAQARAVVEQVTRLVPDPFLYVRIDGVVSAGRHAPMGTFLLMEAELIEPMLFLEEAPGGAARFAEALGTSLARGAGTRS